MHYQISLLCTIVSAAFAVKSSSPASSLRSRQSSEFLVGGSEKPFLAGETGPDRDLATPIEGDLVSPLFPGDWSDTVYSYIWMVDNDALRKTQLGSDYGSESAIPMDVTPVTCFCSAGSLCSCEANEDVNYLDMLVSRSVMLASEDDDVIMSITGRLKKYGSSIHIRGTVLGDVDDAVLSNVSDSEEDDDDDDGSDDDDENDADDVDSEDEDISGVSSDDEVDNVQDILSAGSIQAAVRLSSWSTTAVVVMVINAII